MAATTQHFTTNDGVQLAYELSGNSGPVVVLVHGWSGSRKYFQRNLPALAASCQVTDSPSSLMIGLSAEL